MKHRHRVYRKHTRKSIVQEATTKLECLTCDVVRYSAVSRFTALAQATVPLMQYANVVLGETCPQVPGRNCSHQQQDNQKRTDCIMNTVQATSCGTFDKHQLIALVTFNQSLKKPLFDFVVAHLAVKHRPGVAGSPPPICCNKCN